MDKDLISIQEARECVRRAKAAGEALARMEQGELDKLVAAVARVGKDHARLLAQEAVEETGFGILEHKVIKNLFAAERVFDAIKDQKVVGLL